MSLQKEQNAIEAMIRLFCKGQGHTDPLCEDCSALLAYARERLERCRYGEEKPTCRQCPTHCYKPAMRERITAVMRYAGPRMLLHHPVQGMRHLVREKQCHQRRHRPGQKGVDSDT
jgi:predicted amidophosphoribosyltransferase